MDQTPVYDAEEGAARTVERERIREVLKDNWVGPQRSLLASLNEFRYWGSGQVSALFGLLPPKSDRKLYPLGPQFRSLPTGSKRWRDLGLKVAMVGAVDALALAGSPFLLLASREDRAKAVNGIKQLNVETITSSFFVKASLDLMRQAGEQGKALCVNKWGQFRILDSGYATISHTWSETMGLEYNDEKSEQDERGFNMSHFSRVMEVASRAGVEWVWFDLLAIPKGSDDPTASMSVKQLKTLIINTLHNIYKNADVLRFLLAGCGSQESGPIKKIKIARRAKVITATHVVDFEEMVNALRQMEAADYPRWHQLRLTFDRLLPHTDVGISLADLAMSCDHRSTTNEVDYARGFYALLGLRWQTHFTYEDGMMEILRSQPRHAARIAGMHGPRGLPSPYSWAPKYLAQLQGVIHGGYDCELGSLLGYWYTVRVKAMVHEGYSRPDDKVFFDLLVVNRHGVEVQVQVSMFNGLRTLRLKRWAEETVSSGRARLLCADDMVKGEHPHAVLLVQGTEGELEALGLDGVGEVAESAMMNDGGVEGLRLRWMLS